MVWCLEHDGSFEIKRIVFMVRIILEFLSVMVVSCLVHGLSLAEGRLGVEFDFEGASVKVLEINEKEKRISFMPGGDPLRGWPCWWYFRVTGVLPGETITLKLKGSTSTVNKPGAPLSKPLASSWAMPAQATYSVDSAVWRHTDKGTREDEWMIYKVKPEAESFLIAWGPPYTPKIAGKFLSDISRKCPKAEVTELCRSMENRAVPMLHVNEAGGMEKKRFGVWVQARQHAWESGSSWVAQGFAEWVASDHPDAMWLRKHAEIFIVPIMDVDNTATGNGGKEAFPHDHNRDWSRQPHWKETAAAQMMIEKLVKEDRMDVFLDLHNPGPGDPTFFFTLPDEQLSQRAKAMRDRFIGFAHSRISRMNPPFLMQDKPKAAGAGYTQRWQEMSANWVSMKGNPHTVGLCLETSWNTTSSTTDGYRGVGANLGASIKDFLHERFLKP